MDPTIEGRASFPPTAWTLLAGINDVEVVECLVVLSEKGKDS